MHHRGKYRISVHLADNFKFGVIKPLHTQNHPHPPQSPHQGSLKLRKRGCKTKVWDGAGVLWFETNLLLLTAHKEPLWFLVTFKSSRLNRRQAASPFHQDFSHPSQNLLRINKAEGRELPETWIPQPPPSTEMFMLSCLPAGKLDLTKQKEIKVVFPQG